MKYLDNILVGDDGFKISAIGLGTMSMGGSYGPADDTESLATLNAAFDAGINFFDTADFYGVGHSEGLLSAFLKGKKREEIFLSVKFGPMLIPGRGPGRMNGHPDYIQHALAFDLRRLGVDYIDLYFPARIDRTIPIEDQMGALVEMKQKGFIRNMKCASIVDTKDSDKGLLLLAPVLLSKGCWRDVT